MNKNSIAKHVIKRVLEPSDDKAMQRPVDQAGQRNDPEIALQHRKHWWSRKAQAEIILSPQEHKILKKVKKRAHFLDRGIHCCCFAVGFDGLVGFIPVIGDFIGVFFALALVKTATKVGLPTPVIRQMLINVVIDFSLGLIPILGDVMDIFYKCNTRNAVLLEEFLMTRRRDQMLKDQGKLPEDHLVGTGPIPGTDNERPKGHQGTPRIRAYETDPFEDQDRSSSGKQKLIGNDTSKRSSTAKSGSFFTTSSSKRT
ncbi:unnamed protein product [Umbelopsis ramanniana]